MIGNREVSEEQTNLANFDQRQENFAESANRSSKRKSLSNKDKNNNKSFQGTCDLQFAWQMELDF